MSCRIFVALLATLILSVLSVDSSSNAASSQFLLGSRSIPRSVEKISPDYAVELNATDFDSVLEETPASYAVVEFFAHWCPACRNYKAHYEKVARLFNGADAIHPGIILMTRVDCALKMNIDLCDKFSIRHYPMLLWGTPSKFVTGSWDPKQENSGIVAIGNSRTADRLLTWINKRLNSSYGFDDDKYANEQLRTNVYSKPGEVI